MIDSYNGINHKCPCCGYEAEWDWENCSASDKERFIKGNESFIKIENDVGKTTTFKTDKPKQIDWGEPAYKKVILLGCPKCGCVSFQFY